MELTESPGWRHRFVAWVARVLGVPVYFQPSLTIWHFSYQADSEEKREAAH